MPSGNRILLCAAGGGKTSRVVDQALANTQGKVALVTYTRNNVREIQAKIYSKARAIPADVEILSWYTFLLRELARPFRSALHNKRIDGIFWTEERSARYVAQSNTDAHYFINGRHIYQDKIAKFICACDKASEGAIMNRLRDRFAHVIIDEVQDMAGYDLDLLELMLRSGIALTLVGDHRQATFATNNAVKKKAFAGPAIVGKFEQWEKRKLATIVRERHTHRCNQTIADLSDTLFPAEPATISKNEVVTGHDGIFLVAASHAQAYTEMFSPQVLRYSASTKCAGLDAMNFGQSKGLTFDRVLIFPHKAATSWLKTGDIAHVAKTLAKMYVGVTRARFSVAFVFDAKPCGIAGTRWSPPLSAQ